MSKDPAGVAGGNRWGWTNGPFDNSVALDNAVFDIYGGAAKCDIDKGFGVKVGKVTILTVDVSDDPGPPGNIPVKWRIQIQAEPTVGTRSH